MPSKILVVDDATAIHTLVKARLAKEDVEIHSAMDGLIGIEMAKRIHPDLILLDVEMPGRDGFAICGDLKDDPATMDIPVIFLTGAATTEQKIHGLELGATDYITKPFDVAELKARVRASLRMRALVDLLSKRAMTDGLTGLWNRAYLEARLNTELVAARDKGVPLSCVMADVDRFKSINDTYGHSFGDEVLRIVATTFTETCAADHVICRYGGEEFTVLLPNTPIKKAAELAEMLRTGIESNAIRFRDTEVRVTCSFGVANLKGQVPLSIVELADQALYRAKHSGRNRVEIDEPSKNAA